MLHPPTVEYRYFSAEVKLELRFGAQAFDLASVSPSEIILREHNELPAGDAEIMMIVDGETFLWPIRLPHGAVPFDLHVYTVPRGKMVRIGTQ